MKLSLLYIALFFLAACGDGDKKEPALKPTPREEKVRDDKPDSTEATTQKPEIESDSLKSQDLETEEEPEYVKLKSEEKIKSISELWKTYKDAKTKVSAALEKENLEEVIKYLKIAGECAQDLGRSDISTWQFNNIGHYSILEFKKLTNYEERLQTLATMNSGENKNNYLNDTKTLFRKELNLLESAERYLNQAQIIDDDLEESRRTDVIQRNLDYIAWVKEFCRN
ncbi:hypothetical protein ACFLS9_04475 [Bacteroidota bacterium]